MRRNNVTNSITNHGQLMQEKRAKPIFNLITVNIEMKEHTKPGEKPSNHQALPNYMMMIIGLQFRCVAHAFVRRTYWVLCMTIKLTN